MSSTRQSTIPLRCHACGQQTHKTLSSILQNKGFLCVCGAMSELDITELTREIDKSEARIEDFGHKE